MVKTSPSNAGGAGSIPGRGAKIPHATQCGQKEKGYSEPYSWDSTSQPGAQGVYANVSLLGWGLGKLSPNSQRVLGPIK